MVTTSHPKVTPNIVKEGLLIFPTENFKMPTYMLPEKPLSINPSNTV